MSSREREVRATVNEIHDPCSIAAGMAIGLSDLGIIEEVKTDGGRVRIVISPTMPACRYGPIFADEISQRLQRLPWVTSADVVVTMPTLFWEEDRMAPAVRARLAERRRAARQELRGQFQTATSEGSDHEGTG